MMLRRLLHALAAHLRVKVVDSETPDPATGQVDPSRGQTPLFERYLLGRGPAGGAAYLHHYLRSDPDRGLHDHPYPWAIAVPLAGGYVEERMVGFNAMGPVGRRIRRRPFVPYLLTGNAFHRLHVAEGRTSWSLFIHGPRVKLWGFLRPVKAVDWGNPEATAIAFAHRCFRTQVNDGDEWMLDAPRGRAVERAAP